MLWFVGLFAGFIWLLQHQLFCVKAHQSPCASVPGSVPLRSFLPVGETVILLTSPLHHYWNACSRGRRGCSRMTVSPTASLSVPVHSCAIGGVTLNQRLGHNGLASTSGCMKGGGVLGVSGINMCTSVAAERTSQRATLSARQHTTNRTQLWQQLRKRTPTATPPRRIQHAQPRAKECVPAPCWLLRHQHH